MDDESGKLMEPMGVVPQNEGKHTGSNWSIIRREDDVDGGAHVTKNEERVLQGGWTVTRTCR